MKRAVALFTLAWLSGCFPQYDVLEPDVGTAGAGTGAGGDTTVEPTCKDGERNGAETGIDCGMTGCSKTCPAGQGCAGDVDCESGHCADLICRAASCDDGVQNGDETDKDCGGQQGCARCPVDKRCTASNDCDGGECQAGLCQAPSCKDGLVNGNETDLNCGGGTCTPCEAGKTCTATTDCDNLACSKGKCQAASCSDKLQNQDETDQDCGGSCTACNDGLGCGAATDCQSGVCTAKTCAAPSCTDGVVNGTEPSLDCGGSCTTKCKVLATCRVDADCASQRCASQRCVPAAATGKVLSPAKWIATDSTMMSPSMAMPAKAIDGNPMTDWITGTDQVPGMWFRIDMASDQVVFSIELDCNDAGSCSDPDPSKNDLPVAIDITFSEDPDFANATPIITGHSVGIHEVIVLPEPQVGRYVQISLTQGKGRWWRMDEVRLKQ
jgi:hypothetical protein